MTFEEFRNLAQGIQAIFVALGAIIASGWAIYTFRSLLSAKKAEAELTKINTEIEKSKFEKTKIQKELATTPILSVEVEPFLFGSFGENDLSVRIKLRLENVGNTPEFINWEESTVKAAFVENIDGERLKHSVPISGVLGRIGRTPAGESLWPGEIALDEALIPIEHHGIYVIYADIFVSQESTETNLDLMSNPGSSTAFGVPVYFDTRISEVAK